MKKVLVTGATGLVGTHLVAELLRRTEDYDVTAVAHSEASWTKLDWLLLRQGLTNKPYRRLVAALEYIDDCRTLVSEIQPDVIFHCAARVAMGKARAGEKLVTRNVEITHNLVTATLERPMEHSLEQPKGARPLFVHVSSIAALGGTAGSSGCIDESAVMANLAGASAYARSKFLSENEVWRAAAHGLRVSVVNPAVIIGTMAPNSGFWLNEVFRAVRKGGNRFWIDGETAFVAADDVARAMVLLSATPDTWGKRYILSAENVPYRRFLTQIAQLEEKSAPKFRIPHWILKLAVPFAPSVSSVISPHPRYDGSEIMRAVPFRYSDLADTLSQIAGVDEKI